MKCKKNIDLTGTQVGKLLVLHRTDDKILSSGRHIKRWLCRCACGNEVPVYEHYIRSGHTKSCGCGKYVGLNKAVDLKGQEINGIKVLCRADDEIQCDGSHILKWLCQCHCGNLFVTRGTSLTSGHTKSCGCRKKQLRIKDHEMIGKKFNKLLVESRGPDEITPKGLRFVRWNCICECGAKTLVRGSSLRDGHAISCGCQHNQVLLNRSSNGEAWIAEYLDEKNIIYERQKIYQDLVSVGGKYLAYDFLVHLPDKDILIECQGKQHYEPIDFFGGVDSFERQQENDELKRAYAKFIGVPLFEIDYTITDKDLVIQQLSLIIDSNNRQC